MSQTLRKETGKVYGSMLRLDRWSAQTARVAKFVRGLAVRYWMTILVLMISAFVAVNGVPSLSFAAWIVAFIVVFSAFVISCWRFYKNAKINAHLVLACFGFRPKHASPHYVRALFDGYAERFDRHLMVELSYQAPNLVFEMIEDRLRSGAPVVADLGCGTGICGPLVSRWAGELIGVDLAPRMLECAATKNCYDSLVEDDIVDFLKARPETLDIAIAADVLVYIGDLDAVFLAAFEALKDNGHFAFTVEAAREDGWRLASTGRYVHARSYVEELAQLHGFEVLNVARSVLRRQAGASVWGDVWLLAKPGFPDDCTTRPPPKAVKDCSAPARPRRRRLSPA